MKKIDGSELSGSQNILKWLLLMKLSLFLVISLSLQAVASESYSQKRINLDLKSVTIEAVFKAIESQGAYRFVYKNEILPDEQNVTVYAKEATIDYVMEKVLTNTPLRYRKMDKNLVVILSNDQREIIPLVISNHPPIVIKGVVKDLTGSNLSNVSVFVKGTQNGTLTNDQGEFTLNANLYDSLEVSSVGYKTKSVFISNEQPLIIVLEAEAGTLNEVAVVGYGTQRKVSLVGAQSTIAPKELKQPTGSLSSVLAGRLAGLVVVQRSGEPGRQSADIWIRGITNPNAARAPLVLVDGVERGFDDIDPEDIESFTILKDASATAVYGVRGANGVVIIRTKPGRVGKPAISVDYYHGVTQLTRKPQMADGETYMKLANEASMNNVTPEKRKLIFSEDYINRTLTAEDRLLYPNVNWMNSVFYNYAFNQRANVNVRGGSDMARYYASVSYYGESGMTRSQNLEAYNASLKYNRYNFTTNVNLDASKTTKVDIGAMGFIEEVNRPYISASDVFGMAMAMSPVAQPPMFEIDGKYYVPGTNPNGDQRNPYANLVQRGYQNFSGNQIYSNLKVTQDLAFITPGLNLTAMYAYDVYNSRTNNLARDPLTYNFKDRNNPYDENGNPILSIVFQGGSESLGFSASSDANRSHYLESTLNYNNRFGKHSLGGLLVYNQRSRYYSRTSMIDALPHRLKGLAGRVTYSYDDRYFSEFNAGYNGSENFAPDRRYGFFPAVGVGWVVSNEGFMKSAADVVNLLKLRYTYGLVGNDAVATRFLYLGFMENSDDFGYQFGTGRNGYQGVKIINTPIIVGWETSRKQDLGVDIKLFNSLSITLDLFDEYKKGIFLSNGKMAWYNGLTVNPQANLGILKNRGFDGTIEYFKDLSQDIDISLRGNFTYNNDTYIEDGNPEALYPWRDRKGRNVLARYGLVADGLYTNDEINRINAWEDLPAEDKNRVKRPFPVQFGGKKGLQAGDIKYIDQNNDGIIDVNDEVQIGRGDVPQVVYGFGFTFRYKRVTIGTLFAGYSRADRMIGGSSIHPFGGDGGTGNLFSNINDRWTPENPSQDVFYPRLGYGGTSESNMNNFRSSTWWLRDVSFLRLKNAQVAYDIPESLYRRIGIKKSQLYFLGTNLLTFSKFNMWDPELNTNNGTSYPNTMNLSVGLTINF